MNKWIAEFELEDGDTMPEHMDLDYKGVKLDFHCRPLEQEPRTFKWCETCKEYDQEKHCCHRWSKVIRDTAEEMKQEYIEREVLDKIRAEIVEMRSKQNCSCSDCLDVIDKYKAESENT